MMETTGAAASTAPDAPSTARVIGGVAAGLALALPLSYLLALAGSLPGMLGLFFFLLFGLAIGAAMCRVWTPLRPLRSRVIAGGVVLVVLAGWGGALSWEAAMFPADVAAEAVKQVVRVENKTGSQVRADAVAAVRAYLAENYPPGGVIGYWRWAASEKSITIPITGRDQPSPIPYRSNGGLFVVRVLLCGLALTVAVLSQVRPLARRLEPATGEAPEQEAEPSDTVASGQPDTPP